jgi:hypothetical protein
MPQVFNNHSFAGKFGNNISVNFFASKREHGGSRIGPCVVITDWDAIARIQIHADDVPTLIAALQNASQQYADSLSGDGVPESPEPVATE